MTLTDMIIMWGARAVLMISLVYAIWHYLRAASRCAQLVNDVPRNLVGKYGYLFLAALASIVALGLIPEWMGIIEWNQLGEFIHGSGVRE